jgi:hypothetical protein
MPTGVYLRRAISSARVTRLFSRGPVQPAEQRKQEQHDADEQGNEADRPHARSWRKGAEHDHQPDTNGHADQPAFEVVSPAALLPPPPSLILGFAASFVLLLMRTDSAALRGPVSELTPVAPELAVAAAVVLATFGLLRVQRTLAAQDDFS